MMALQACSPAHFLTLSSLLHTWPVPALLPLFDLWKFLFILIALLSCSVMSDFLQPHRL